VENKSAPVGSFEDNELALVLVVERVGKIREGLLRRG
jgi:hypothetical protein